MRGWRWRGRWWCRRRWRGRRRVRRRRALVATSVRTASRTSESARAKTCKSRMSCTRHRDRPRERTAHEPLDARERWLRLERLRLERLRSEWRQRSGLRLSSGRWGGSTTGGRQLAATASRASSMPGPSACDATRREQQSSVGAAAAHQHRTPAGVAAARPVRGTKHAPFSDDDRGAQKENSSLNFLPKLDSLCRLASFPEAAARASRP